MKKLRGARMAALIALLAMVFISVDLGFNFLKSMVPSLNDGIGCFSIFQIAGIFEPFGDGGWSHELYLNAFETSVWVTFCVLIANIALKIAAERKDARQ